MSTFNISVKTSDRFGAGTDANVYVCLIDKNGKKSKPTQLDAFFTNDFERHQLDEFTVRLDKLEEITEIEVWRDDSGLGDAWHLEYISAEDMDTKKKVVFSFNRWVEAKIHYFIEPYDSVLPQHAKYLTQRNEELAKRKELYKYIVNHPNFPVQSELLPADEKFSDKYTWDLGTTRITLLIQKVWVAATKDKEANFESLDEVFDVYGYYSNMPIPKDARRWREDTYFGYQRLNGCNPKMIQLCKAIPDNFKVDPDVLKPLLDGKTVEKAISNKKLFIIDLTVNDGNTTKDGAVLTSPYCLLYLNNKKELVPVAIQLFKTPAPDNPVFYSSDDKELWTLAKIWYCLADANYHQGAVHLGGTHIIMESFLVSVNRNFSPSHPLYRLLAPHFINLLPINFRALKSLMGPGGYVDLTMAVGAAGLVEVVAKRWGTIDVTKSDILNDLKERGVLNDDILPNYYYRDDAKLVHTAINNYASKMVKLFYKSEKDIVDDVELQNWGKELVAPKPNGLGCVGVPGDGSFSKHDQITAVVTFIISTCSVEHAAVNFSQYDSYAFPPAYPVRLNGSPPKDKTPVTEADIVKIFCNKEHMMRTLMVAKYLSMRGTKPLGDFEVVYHHHPDAAKIDKEFRDELKRASDVITKRDQQRKVPYEILNPVIIPNSISI